MSNELALVPISSTDAFLDAMARVQSVGRPRRPQPDLVRLAGKVGVYQIEKYNPDTKQREKTDLGLGPVWSGTIILVRWFAQWKYEEGATHMLKTREFSNFQTDPVHLLDIDFSMKGKAVETVKETFDSYQDLKAKYAIKSELSDKVKQPFELIASAYLWVPELARVVRAEFHGTSRSAFFDYLKDYPNGLERPPKALVEVITEFSSNLEQSALGPYYRATFKSAGLNNEEQLKGVMEATMGLGQWMQAAEGQTLPEISEMTDAAEELEVEIIPPAPAGTPIAEDTNPSKGIILAKLRQVGFVPKNEEEVRSVVKSLTQLEMVPENYDAISVALQTRVEGMKAADIRIEDIPF